jgi:hypothetical protein
MSANILDFRIPQKHVVCDMPTTETGSKAAARTVNGQVHPQLSQRARKGWPAPDMAPIPIAGGKENEFEI